MISIKGMKEERKMKESKKSNKRPNRARPGPREVGQAELELGQVDLASSQPELTWFRPFVLFQMMLFQTQPSPISEYSDSFFEHLEVFSSSTRSEIDTSRVHTLMELRSRR